MRFLSAILVVISAVGCVPPAAQGAAPPGECAAAAILLVDAVPRGVPPREARPANANSAADGQCLLSIEAFLSARETPIVVDARPLRERRHVRIPTAIEIEPGEIADKPFLHGKNVVVIGTGLDAPRLCAAASGPAHASLRVLDGGVRALHRAGRPLQGSVEALAALAWVSAAELHGFMAHGGNGLVLAGFSVDAGIPEALQRARRAASREPGPLAQELRELSRRNGIVVAVTPDDASARALQDTLASTDAPGVFVLHRGAGAYRAYLDEQARIAGHANLRLTRPCGAG